MPSATWGSCARLCRVFSGAASNTTTSFRRAARGSSKPPHTLTYRGYKFSTYAVPVILGEMRRLFREGGTVKVSRGLKELSMKAVHLSEQIETETGKAPSVSVLAEKLGVPEEKCAEALNAAAQPVSLTGDDENNETDIPVDAPEEKITDHLALQQILKALPEEDQRLIYYRYFKNQTQTETAKRLGTTQVQISRREKKLLLHLRGLLL